MTYTKEQIKDAKEILEASLSLAEKNYWHERAQEDLWNQIQFNILNEKDYNVYNAWVDEYDNSVEVLLGKGELNKELAIKILDLGFATVFETRLWEDEDNQGFHWSRSADGKFFEGRAYPRKILDPDEHYKRKYYKLLKYFKSNEKK